MFIIVVEHYFKETLLYQLFFSTRLKSLKTTQSFGR